MTDKKDGPNIVVTWETEPAFDEKAYKEVQEEVRKRKSEQEIADYELYLVLHKRFGNRKR
jgi:prophage tail gpP-like protein